MSLEEIMEITKKSKTVKTMASSKLRFGASSIRSKKVDNCDTSRK